MKLLKDERILAAAIFLIATYLLLWNLGYVALWHDEGTDAIMARNFLHFGAMTGWDGRNLFVGDKAINNDLILASYPPWPAIPSALGMAIFGGTSEWGVRFFHALLGVLSLPVLWLLLRMDFVTAPRLRVLAFVMFALSAQVILFMRQGRYGADAMLFSLLTFYCYRLYIARGGRLWHLALAAFFTFLNFLNQFAIGVSFALSLAVWHLIYYHRQTTAKQWLTFAATGALTAAACLGYGLWVGIIGGDVGLEYGSEYYKNSWLKRHAVLVYYNFRETLKFGLLPLWTAVWLMFFIIAKVSRKQPTKRKKRGRAPPPSSPDNSSQIIRWAVLAGLILLMSGVVSPQPIHSHQLANSRYLVAALPFIALINAAFINWVWERDWGVLVAVPLLAAMLFSNALAYPFIFPNLFTQKTVRLTLPPLIEEIHRPYSTSTGDVAEYLRTHAKQDETIDVTPWQDYAGLLFYLSDKLIFCCSLDGSRGLSKQKVRDTVKATPIYKGDIKPDWYVVFNGAEPSKKDYDLVHTSESFFYVTQRPELEFRTFEPIRNRGPQARIYRLKDSAR